jgi:radical SAM protein with 4Fe4S-binding SPASM domain
MSMGEQKEVEPGLSSIRKAYEYLTKKLGDEAIFKTGTSDASTSYCKTYFAIKHDGGVIPCSHFEDYPTGNVLEESLADIFERSRDELLFNDFSVEGFCGKECPNRQICFGCRANALRYAGDKKASDPKCWWNPSNSEYCL